MTLVFALCSTFMFTSCGEDDINDATTFSNYELVIETSATGEREQTIFNTFAPQLESYSKQLTNVNQLVAKKVFDLAMETLDSTFQEQVNGFLSGDDDSSSFLDVEVLLVNTADGSVVASKKWQAIGYKLFNI